MGAVDSWTKLVSMLLGPTGADPDRICLVDGTRTWTRAQARAEVAGCIGQLREHGIGPGDRVLVLLDHDARGVFFLAAASAMGLRLLMPYNLQAAAATEWLTIAAAAAPDAVVHLKRDRSAVAELQRAGCRVVELTTNAATGTHVVTIDHPVPVEHFVVLFTSGTTGAPKAISVSEALICQRVRTVTGMLKFDADARVFMSGLLNNTTGVIFSFGALAHDAVLFFPEGRDVASWPEQVERHRATHIMLRPVAMKRFIEAAAASRHDLSSLRTVAYGAAAMPRAVLEAGRSLMPCDWVQGYGLSETFGPFCWLDEAGHREQRYREGTYCVGRPDSTLEVRLEPVDGHAADLGEVLVRGRAVMEGYLDVRSGVVTAPGEWLRTGDLGCWSGSGDLLLKGRLSGSLLSANGHRIYPEEVEAVLVDVPGVDDAVLVGVHTGDGAGERPVACISGALGSRHPGDIRSVVSQALEPVLSREKWPDLVYAVTTPFPKSANDKVMRAHVLSGIDHAALIQL